jgi:hypothetical protein
MHAERADKKMLIFSDKEFYNKYRRERQGQLAEYNGIEILLVEC